MIKMEKQDKTHPKNCECRECCINHMLNKESDLERFHRIKNAMKRREVRKAKSQAKKEVKKGKQQVINYFFKKI